MADDFLPVSREQGQECIHCRNLLGLEVSAGVNKDTLFEELEEDDPKREK